MNKNRRIAFLLAVLFCLSAVTFVAVAKYIKDIPFTGNVTFKADLAETFSLTESEAKRNTDGTYSLDTSKSVESNTYTLMPGVDVPKDPKITIKGKTAVPAYLYVEVLESKNFPATVTYSIVSHWKALGIKGPHGGDDYVYAFPDGTVIILDGTVKDLTIRILDKDTLYVSDQLDRGTTATMTIYGYMAQQVSAYANATETFTANFPTP